MKFKTIYNRVIKFRFLSGILMIALSVAKGCTSRNLRKRKLLPIKGTIRFIPRPGDVMRCQILRRDGGYVDSFNNIWKRPKGENLPIDFHWDVQLSTLGKISIGHYSNSGNHVNVTQDGRIAH